MMKKITALALACVMSIGLLAGCGGGNNAAPSTDPADGAAKGKTLTVSLAGSCKIRPHPL